MARAGTAIAWWSLIALGGGVIAALALFGLFMLFVLLAATGAFAHESWINQNRLTDPASGEWCCNHIDCRSEKVSEIAGGYRVETGETVPYGRVIWKSPDGSWWRCRNLSTNATRCLIGPPPGS